MPMKIVTIYLNSLNFEGIKFAFKIIPSVWKAVILPVNLFIHLVNVVI